MRWGFNLFGRLHRAKTARRCRHRGFREGLGTIRSTGIRWQQCWCWGRAGPCFSVSSGSVASEHRCSSRRVRWETSVLSISLTLINYPPILLLLKLSTENYWLLKLQIANAIPFCRVELVRSKENVSFKWIKIFFSQMFLCVANMKLTTNQEL